MHKKFREAKAFSPAGITSFFEICDTKINGEPIKNPLKIGARGGGFVIDKGVTTRVLTRHSKKNQISVSINRKVTPGAETTKAVVNKLLHKAEQFCDVKIDHNIEVPIGSGYGSSGAGALSTALALNKALELELTYNELGRIAHIAEVECKTGLGTVGPLMIGGCVLTVKSGAPGYNCIDKIPLGPNYKLVSIYFGQILTKDIITMKERKSKINKWGNKTLDSILKRPTIENFMNSSKEFAEGIGLMTNRVIKAVRSLENSGVIGVTQNMIGEAIHSIVEEDSLRRVVCSARKIGKNVFIFNVDSIGARLI